MKGPGAPYPQAPEAQVIASQDCDLLKERRLSLVADEPHIACTVEVGRVEVTIRCSSNEDGAARRCGVRAFCNVHHGVERLAAWDTVRASLQRPPIERLST